MAGWWRGALLALAVFSLFWLTSVWQWQTHGTDVQARDLFLQLLVAPVLVCAAAWAAWWLLRRTREGVGGGAGHDASQGASPAMASGASASSASASAARSGPAWAPLAVWGQAWVLPGALADLPASECAEALVKGAARPVLDPELVDFDGLPVYAARCEQVDRAVDENGVQHGDGPVPEQAPDQAPVQSPLEGGAARTLALLSALSEQVWAQVQAAGPDPWAEPLGDADTVLAARTSAAQPASAGSGPTWLSGVASSTRAEQAPRGRLFLRVLVPASWPTAWQQAALRACVAGAPALPTLLDLDADVWPVDSTEGLWAHLADWRSLHARRPSAESLWVLAADSLLDADVVDRMQASGELFTPHHQLGRIPGEGAAAVWLCPPAWAPWATAQGLQAPAWAHAEPESRGVEWASVRHAQRESSADRHGRAHTATLQALLASDDDAAPAWVVSDADHRASRTAELFEALTERLPAIDPMQQVLRLGDACGDLGLARALVCLALASALPAPATVALLHDPLRRTVLHLRAPSESEVVK